jgi:hypothetical protein
MNGESWGERGRSRRTFIFVVPRGWTYAEIELTFINFVYFPNNAAVDESDE